MLRDSTYTTALAGFLVSFILLTKKADLTLRERHRTGLVLKDILKLGAHVHPQSLYYWCGIKIVNKEYLLRKSLCLSHTAHTRPTVKTHCRARLLSGKGKEVQLVTNCNNTFTSFYPPSWPLLGLHVRDDRKDVSASEQALNWDL